MKSRPMVSLAIFLTATLLLSACGSEPTPVPATTSAVVPTASVSATTGPTSGPTPSVAATTSAATTSAATTSTPVTTTGQTAGFLTAKYSTPVLDSGHSSSVYAVALSPDGKTLATGSDDTTVKLWDVATKKLLYTFKDYGHSIGALAFSPDGTRLAASGSNESVNIWEIASGKTIQVLEIKNAYSFVALAYSADGKFLAGANDDKNIYVWETASGTLKNTLKGQYRPLKIAFSPDAKLVAAADISIHVNVWDLSQPDKPLATFKSEFDTYALKFSSDNKTVYGANSLWEISSGKALTTFSDSVVGVSSDDKQVAVYDSSKKQVEILNSQNSQQIAKLTVASDLKPAELFLSPDFKTLAAAATGNKATVYNVSQDKVLASIGDTNASETIVAISPDATLIAHTTVKDYNRTIEILNAADGKVINSFKVDVILIEQMAFSADSKMLAAGGAIWDVKTGKQLANLLKGSTSLGGTFEIFSPDGKTVAMSNRSGPVSLWDIQGNQKATIKPIADYVESLTFSPDGKNLAVATDDGVEVYDLSTTTPALLKSYRTGLIYTVAFSPDQKSLLIGGSSTRTLQIERTNPNNNQGFEGQEGVKRVAYSSDGTRVFGIGEGLAIVWDTKSQKEIARTNITETYNVTDMAVSADDKLLITAQSDGTVKVWQLPPAGTAPAATSTVTAAATAPATVATSPTPIPTVKASLTLKTSTAPAAGHTTGILAAQLSPDGKILASASNDTTIRLWDLAGKKLLRVLKGNFEYIQRMQFSQDGKTLGVYNSNYGGGGLAQTWDIATGQPLTSLQLSNEYGRNVGFSGDLKLIAGATNDKVVVLEMSSGQKLSNFAFPRGASALAFSSDAKILYAAGGSSETRQTIGLFNLQSAETINITDLIAGDLLQMAISPDQKVLAAITRTGPVVMVDGQTGKQLGSYTQPDKYVASALDFDASNNLKVVYTDKDKNSLVYSVAIGSGKPLGKVEFKGDAKTNPIGLSLNANNSVLVFGDTKGNLTAANTTDGAVLATFPGSELAFPVASVFNPQNRTWLVLNRNGVVQIWDAALSKPIATLGQPNPVLAADEYLALSPDGKLLATGGDDSPAITLWNLETNQKIATLPASGASSALRFSNDNTQLLALVRNITLYSWDASDKFASAHNQANLISSATYNYAKFSLDGTLLGYETTSKTIGILDLKANKVSTLSDKYSSFTFLPNSPNLMVIGENGEVKIIDLGGKTLATLDKSNSTLLDAAFSPDGKIAATRSGSGLMLWDTATWGKIFDTGSVQTSSWTLAFTPDGKSLLSGNADGSATLWEVK